MANDGWWGGGGGGEGVEGLTWGAGELCRTTHHYHM